MFFEQYAGLWHHGMSFSQGSYWRKGCITPQGVRQTSDLDKVPSFFCLQSLSWVSYTHTSEQILCTSFAYRSFFFWFHNHQSRPSLYTHYTSCLGPRGVHKGPCLHLLSKPVSANNSWRKLSEVLLSIWSRKENKTAWERIAVKAVR